ncbi:MAG TPA: ATP phosphoribosyltransferase regulatory subunit [Thermoanaerobaculia bacterium]|jgi:ATP phosphoribosyltransferase regulatory subunit
MATATEFRYPTGARPLLIEETARRRRIETRIASLLGERGFDEIVLPIIDFAEPYSGVVDRGAVRQSYRFVDRDGELVAIRSDFTPMVARALAPALTAAQLPLRVWYRGDVIRCEATRLGANRELFQIGAELVGDASVEADIEAMQLAAQIVTSFGIEPLVVYNDVSLVEQFAPDVREALVTKRMRDGLPPLAAKMIAGTVTLDDLPRAIAERLRRIAGVLDPERFVLHLDDVDTGSGYYTGLRFRVYGTSASLWDSGAPEGGQTRVSVPRKGSLAEGGRYDNLYERFGARAAAVGFTFTIDDLERD